MQRLGFTLFCLGLLAYALLSAGVQIRGIHVSGIDLPATVLIVAGAGFLLFLLGLILGRWGLDDDPASDAVMVVVPRRPARRAFGAGLVLLVVLIGLAATAHYLQARYQAVDRLIELIRSGGKGRIAPTPPPGGAAQDPTSPF